MIKLRRHTNIALTYFLIVGCLGIFLRFFFVTPIEANFRYIVHAHSHIALLGWVYIGITTLIYRIYFTQTSRIRPYRRILWFTTYRRIFWFTNFTLLGMLFSFPFQGYALFSITFSTLFLFASYLLVWFVFKNIPVEFKHRFSYKCIKAALWYMVISSIGPWAIGIVMAILGNTSIWYKLSIYFYLHFQYNAWFILSLCGILFFLFEKYNISLKKEDLKNFFLLVNSGIILTVFLSALWVDPPLIIYILGGIGAILQVLAFLQFFKMLKEPWQNLKLKFSRYLRFLLLTAGIILMGKVIIQLISAFPYFADLAYNFPDFIIGYLHWTFLGAISISLFGFLMHFNLLKVPKWIFLVYFTGFILSEALIFFKAIGLWLGIGLFPNYFLYVVIASSLLPLSIYILWINNYISRKTPTKHLHVK